MSQFRNFEDMFAQSIGLKEPWSIEKAEFSEKERAVHIYVKASKTSKYACTECGKLLPVWDFDRERVWQHGDVVFFPCYVHCKRPRVKCPDCGKIHVAETPWARARSRYTLLFESYALMLCEHMPVEQARKYIRISHTSLTNIIAFWVKKRVEAQSFSRVFKLCIDETSFLRGQSYVTIVTDPDTRRVIDVEDGRSSQQVWDFSIKFENQGGDCLKVTQAACDMSGAYLSGIRDCFPKAQIVIDRFHVSQLMRKAMDEVRREEQGKKVSRSRKSGKKLLMKPQRKMDEQQEKKLAEISKMYPKTGRAFRMVQAFDEVYLCNDITEAETVFEKLYKWLRRSRLEPMKQVATTLLKHKTEILAYYAHRLTNAIAEGINSLIQAGKRKARGFHTFRGYSTMIYLQCSKINFPPIPLFA